MILQNIIFPSTDNCVEEELFFRRSSDTHFALAEECIYMKKKSSIYFDTFFNSFSATNWFTYTSLKEVNVRLFIEGSVRVSIFAKQQRGDEIFKRCIFEKYYDSSKDGDYFDATINTVFSKGIFSIEILAITAHSKFKGGFFYTGEEVQVQNVKLAAIVNHKNNIRYIDNLVDSIKKYFQSNNMNTISDNITVEIVNKTDNCLSFDKENNFVSVVNDNVDPKEIRQKMKQKLMMGGATHVLLLDDEETINPESIFRIYRFYTMLKSEFSNLLIMGTELRDDYQWCGLKNKKSKSDVKNLYDYRSFLTILKNETEIVKKYDSWFCGALPVKAFLSEDISNSNFCLPSEISNQNRYCAIRMNGIAVWHEPICKEKLIPAWKSYFDNLEDKKSEVKKDVIQLQNILFPSTKNCTEELLYFRRIGNIRYSLIDDRIYIGKDGIINLDTYFNGFSASKWFKYTNLQEVGIRLHICGVVRISLIYKEKTSSGIIEKCIHESIFDSDENGEIFEEKFDPLFNKGMYCISVMGMSDESEFLGGFFYTEGIKQKDVRLAIGICTFKREAYVYKNMKMLEDMFLLNEKSELHNRLFIYISDNAKTLDCSKFGSSQIRVFENKNVGGAGGFTRVMIEAKKQQKETLTHILLMDDDVVMQPEAIYRTYKVLSLLKDEYSNAFIGGAMLRTDLQWFQTEAGGTWNAGQLVSHKQGLDLRTLDACLYNETEEKCDFNAWWYCAFPLDVVREDNLPMPIFIRGDDVEFGLRNMKTLILMNGICVWHEPFENKYSSSMFYYIFRNRLIDNAVREIEYSKMQFLSDFKEQFFREVFTLRYKNAVLLLEGVNDFLKGPDWLISQDGEELNKQIMSKSYKLQDLSELSNPFDYPEYEKTLQFIESPKEQKKRIITLNGLFEKPIKKYVSVPVNGAHIAYFYRVQSAINYDTSSNKAFETYFDRNEELSLFKSYFKLKKKINKEYDSAKQAYSSKKTILNSIEFWEKYLEQE